MGRGSWVMGQVRPPGHHAGVRQAMGFCLHNNAAIAASAAQAAGAKKVLIVDWVIIFVIKKKKTMSCSYLTLFIYRMYTMEMELKKYLSRTKQ